MAEKTEQASQRKLNKAREQGDVPKAKDLTTSVSFAVGYFTMFYLMHFILMKMGLFFLIIMDVDKYYHTLINPYNGDLNLGFCYGMIFESMKVIALTSMPISIASILGGMITTIAFTGVPFTLNNLSFKLSRFNFINNIKSRFQRDSIIAFIKQIITAAIVAVVIYNTLKKEETIYIIVYSFVNQLPLIIANCIHIIDEIVRKVILVLIIIGLIDAAYQYWTYQKKQMMDKQESKQDYKESEGDPQIKGKRKEFAKEIAYSDGPMEAAKKSTLVVTNPIHIAVSISYDIDKSPLPIVTGKGGDDVSENMKKIALENNVKIEENPDLAWKLFYTNIGDSAPVETFQALANILQTIASVKEKLQLHDKQGNS